MTVTDPVAVQNAFGISRELPLNYVVRNDVDVTFNLALLDNKHIVVYGTSKQGKTSLRKYNLDESKYVSLVCQNRWTLAQLHGSILKAAGYTVEGTSTHTLTGENKLSAKFTGGVNWHIWKAEATAGGELTSTDATTVEETPLELDPEDVNDIIAALDHAQAPKFIVLDDFHYLPEETQKTFASALKAFHDESKYQFIIAGVWLDDNKLLQYNGDLGGRVISISADKWTDDELREVIASGEVLLNIKFDSAFVDELIESSFDSVWVVQDVCLRACRAAGIQQTHAETSPLYVEGNVADLIRETVGMHSARFNGFLSRFADGFQTSRLAMYRWLLYVALTASSEELERGLSLGHITRSINDAHPERPINSGNITQALQSAVSLQVTEMRLKPIILDYDETDRKLSVVDRTFIIWLRNQDPNELLEMIGMPAAVPAND